MASLALNTGGLFLDSEVVLDTGDDEDDGTLRAAVDGERFGVAVAEVVVTLLLLVVVGSSVAATPYSDNSLSHSNFALIALYCLLHS